MNNNQRVLKVLQLIGGYVVVKKAVPVLNDLLINGSKPKLAIVDEAGKKTSLDQHFEVIKQNVGDITRDSIRKAVYADQDHIGSDDVSPKPDANPYANWPKHETVDHGEMGEN